jgi:hypothetical protein
MGGTKWNNEAGKILICGLVAALSCSQALYSAAARAEQPQDVSKMLRAKIALFPGEELEKVFWVCDYTATKEGIDSTPMELCSAVFDVVRDLKFGGDFDQLLRWWQQNKQTEHSGLAGHR